MQLKTTNEAIEVLDRIGANNPQALALFFQLMNSSTGSLLKSEIRLRKGLDRAVKMLSGHGLIEVSKDIVQCVYLIDSNVVTTERKARRKKAEIVDWEVKLAEKGGNVQGVKDTIIGDSKAAVFYRNELAENYTVSTIEFDSYKKFVAMLWKGNLDDPLKRVLAIPNQLSFKRFVSAKLHLEETRQLIDILRGMEGYSKDYTDLGLTMVNWLKRRNERG